MSDLPDGDSYPSLLENLVEKLVKIHPPILQLTELGGEMGSCSDTWYAVTAAVKPAPVITTFLFSTLSIQRVRDSVSECVL